MRTHCRSGQHLWTAASATRRRCVACTLANERRRYYARRYGDSAIPAVALGQRNPQKHIKSWITRRERYGPSGFSDEGRRTHQVKMRRVKPWLHRRTKLGRPRWIEDAGARISLEAHDEFYHREYGRLRSAVIATHPDKGGTAKQFIQAKTKLDRFLTTQRAWYQHYGLTPPNVRKPVIVRAA